MIIEAEVFNQKASANSRCPRRSLINHHLMTTHRKYLVAALLPTLGWFGSGTKSKHTDVHIKIGHA